LREIGLEEGLPSYLIADGSEIDPVWFEGINTVGLTAGASAPEELVQSVITAIRALGPVTVEQLDGVEEKIAFRLPPTLRHLKARNAAHNNLDNKTAASEEADSLSNDTEQEA